MGQVIDMIPARAMTRLNRILHVEDDPDIREIARMSLEMVGGFALLQCSSGEEALRLAEDFAPDMILMDVMMPGMDGRETVERLREKAALADAPVVFVTAKAANADVEALKTDFGAMVVVKPFDPIALPDELRRLWDEMTAG